MARGARDSLITRYAPISEMMPMGRFTRKIHRQAPPVMSSRMITPPTTGPAMVARPMVAPSRPNTRPRSCGGKLTWMTDSTCGNMSAAISPCTTREMSSMTALCASPHSAEATTKPPMPIMNSRLRPKMSPSRPPVISSSA